LSDVAFFGSYTDTPFDFLDIEWFASAITFHNHQGLFFNTLVGGKTVPACQAFPSSTNGGTTTVLPRFKHFVIHMTAMRA
jgi:hypothetical protein